MMPANPDPVYVPTHIAVGLVGRSAETLTRYHNQGLVRRKKLNARVIYWCREDLLRLAGMGDAADADPQSEEDRS